MAVSQTSATSIPIRRVASTAAAVSCGHRTPRTIDEAGPTEPGAGAIDSDEDGRPGVRLSLARARDHRADPRPPASATRPLRGPRRLTGRPPRHRPAPRTGRHSPVGSSANCPRSMSSSRRDRTPVRRSSSSNPPPFLLATPSQPFVRHVALLPPLGAIGTCAVKQHSAVAFFPPKTDEFSRGRFPVYARGCGIRRLHTEAGLRNGHVMTVYAWGKPRNFPRLPPADARFFDVDAGQRVCWRTATGSRSATRTRRCWRSTASKDRAARTTCAGSPTRPSPPASTSSC